MKEIKETSNKRIVHIKIKNIRDIHKCNYMKYFNSIKDIIGDGFDLQITDANMTLTGERAKDAIVLTIESDSDRDMTQLILSLKGVKNT